MSPINIRTKYRKRPPNNIMSNKSLIELKFVERNLNQNK